jgi:hypothetical protein
MFSSRCSSLPVPGIGSMRGDFFSSQAMALQVAASTPDITRPRIRAAIGAAFTLGTCPTPIPYSRDSNNVERDRIDVGEISRCHSQDDEFANLNVYSGASNGCASTMTIAVLMFRARAPRVGP